MSSHDGILSLHLVCVCYFVSSITSAYVNNFTVLYVQKKLPGVRGHIFHNYISLLCANWPSLKWPAEQVYRLSNFMAAYGRGRLLRDTTDQRLACSCVWRSVPSPAMLTSASVTRINRRGHRQMQYSETRPAPQRCDCMSQSMREQLNSAWEVEMTNSADRRL